LIDDDDEMNIGVTVYKSRMPYSLMTENLYSWHGLSSPKAKDLAYKVMNNTRNANELQRPERAWLPVA